MVSPSKKRKLNSGLSAHGLEYFFAKQQRTKDDGTTPKADVDGTSHHYESSSVLATDEELARRLQAEFDLEAQAQPNQTDPRNTAKIDVTETSSLANPESVVDESIPITVARDSTSTKTLALQSTSTADDKLSESLPLDQSPFVFEPCQYLPALKDQWKSQGGNASYAVLIRCFVLINSTASRIKIVDTLVNCLRLLIEGDPTSLLPAVWLATNAISSPYESLELGLGSSAISRALKKVCGLDNRALKALFNKHGDAGDVAFEAKKKQTFTLRKREPLTIQDVYSSLVKIAQAKGQGSGEIKQSIVNRLLQNARGGEESRYLVRTLCQHLRIGAVKATMLIALSRAFVISKPLDKEFPIRSTENLSKLKKEELAEIWMRGEQLVKGCFARRPNYADIIPVLLEMGVSDELALRCGLSLHTPLRPMLASITRDLSEMLNNLHGRDFTCEFKYDGQRAQIHCDEQGKISLFSRHLELMTDKYPDLVALIHKIRGEGVNSFIMEGEVVAVDPESGDLMNFQTLSGRARKDVDIGSVKIQICLFAFDLMYLNGRSLLDSQLRDRRDLLRSSFVEIPGQFTWAKSIDATSQDSEAVLDFYQSAIRSKCEGIMVKILDNAIDSKSLDGPHVSSSTERSTAKDLSKRRGKSGQGEVITKPGGYRKTLLATYEPDKRLESWLKVKKDYNASFDTLDLIPVAAWHGSGRKAKWWSPILMAVRNEETGSLEAVCKCMSGFTDVFYKANRAFYSDGTGEGEAQNTRESQPAFVEYTGPSPDIWFEPQEVWEMGFADITLSPTYSAGIELVNDGRGLSLRFPRFIKKREDKSIEEASTNEFLAELYRKQEAAGPKPAQEAIGEGVEEE
ncbi:DNA ligase 1 [Ceratocystis fimbriata CBS 114723]|uniref:DNA ligase n=1 Tax=Ceratocystis fimbriata CBS 114723 TaxID=1035309 RepID=A0A2C5X7D8_9PEZI|nr:DNA ligase 1 [Ceratocystis fimbriata CBS 114723]